jgi:CBS domain-containing protein
MHAASENASHDQQKDHFLQLMLGEPNRRSRPLPRAPLAARAEDEYLPLRHTQSSPGDRYTLPVPSSQAPVRFDSPATEVMTDLHRVNAVTIDRNVSIDDATHAMTTHGVRALFVVDDARQVSGIITSTDTLGEKPMRFAQARGIRHGEVLVRDIMTPAERLEILVDAVRSARVGDVIATLRLAGRQHALVVETDPDTAAVGKVIRGIFSLTQIARQLGIPPQHVHDIARTFAEIEEAIAP